jgi:predicted RNase H-like nuclease (RuvC/YqgF family)
MKNWIKNNIIQIIVILILVFVIFMQKCGVKRTNNVINNSGLQQAVNHVKDSLNAIHYNELIANYEAGLKAEAVNTAIYKDKASKYKTESERLKHISDSLIAKYPIDTTCKKIVTAKQAEIDTLNVEVENIGQEAESYSRQLYLCEKGSILKDTVILKKINLINQTNDLNTKLTKELKAKNNWFNRNKIWFGVVAGIVGTLLVIK